MNGAGGLPSLVLPGDWSAFPDWADSSGVCGILRNYLPGCRWFGSRSREIGALGIESVVRLEEAGEDPVFLCILSVEFPGGPAHRYLLPLAREREGEVDPKGRIALLETPSSGVFDLVDGFYLPEAGRRVLGRFFSDRDAQDGLERVTTAKTETLRRLWNPELLPGLFRGEQSNTSLLFEKTLMLKCFRHLETGINPDLEVGVFLAEAVPSAPIPPTGGALLSRTPEGKPLTLVLLQGFVENQGDGWSWLKGRLERLLETDGSIDGQREKNAVDRMVTKLALRTGELHQSLARDPDHPDFAPEPMESEDLDLLVRSVLSGLERVGSLLEGGVGRFPRNVLETVALLQAGAGTIRKLVRECRERVSGGSRIRCHGDFHLGQVLVTPEEEIVFLDFEGEPALPLETRRVKTSPFQDVAGMLRSFHYLSMALVDKVARAEGGEWRSRWFREQSGRYLSAYLESMRTRPDLLPANRGRQGLLILYLLRKTLYEVEYEINNRPEWLPIPLSGLELFLDPDLLSPDGPYSGLSEERAP